jgi:unsaturated rhamnogalacturonyl hydrolase
MKHFLQFLIFFQIITGSLQGQITVGLDNWFNSETSPKTGMPYHYLWTDTADSGYSRWGEIFRKMNARIVTVYKPDMESLESIQIYIIVDPDSVNETPDPHYFQLKDIQLISSWVKRGGVLVILGNDGKHCGLASVNQLMSKFGMAFNHTMLHPVINNQYDMGAYTGLPEHPVFKGIQKIFMKEVASIKIWVDAKPVLLDNGQPVMAECRYGKGFVFVVGDPWIYNEYIDHDRLPADFENRKAAENLTRYLISQVRLRPE